MTLPAAVRAVLEHPRIEPYARVASRLRRRLFERFGSGRYSRPALFELDRKLQAYLPERDGVFVEAGAYDGYLQSNTYYFERVQGWTGVLVEPVPELYEVCVRERPASQVFNCALVPPAFEGQPIVIRVGGLMSLVRGAQGSPDADVSHAQSGTRGGRDPSYDISVKGRTLSSVLDEAGLGAIDLLVLDVEGYEPDALAGLDFERHAPRYILVEMLEPERTHAGIEAVIGGRYEAIDQLSPYDYLYRRLPSPPAPGLSQRD